MEPDTYFNETIGSDSIDQNIYPGSKWAEHNFT